MRIATRVARLTAATAAAAALFVLGLTGCDRESPITSNTTTPSTPAAAPKTTVTETPTPPPAYAPVSFNDQFQDVPGTPKPDKVMAKVIQTVALFNGPASSAIGIDGKTMFVTNSAATLNGMLYQQGAVSKLEIDGDGRLKMIAPKFADALQQPTGITVLPKATKKFAAGALLVCTGATNACDDKRERIVDITKFNTGVTILDPDTGKLLGFIPMGTGRAVAKAISHPVLAPAGICFDPAGDLYVVDSGNTGKELDPQVFGRPGIIKIPHGSIDAVSEDKDSGNVAFLSISHVPSGVVYSRLDDAIYWTTCDGTAGAGGAAYRIERGNFPQQNGVGNVLGDVGALMGVAITPNGTLVVSRLDGDLYFINRKRMDQVPFAENGMFSSPWDIKLVTMRNGNNLLYVPEQEPNATEPWKQRLRVILLPSGL